MMLHAIYVLGFFLAEQVAGNPNLNDRVAELERLVLKQQNHVGWRRRRCLRLSMFLLAKREPSRTPKILHKLLTTPGSFCAVPS